MPAMQIIQLDGQPVAVAVAGVAIVNEHVPAQQLVRAQAKALYALQIQAGERRGPTPDARAERYARRAVRLAASRRTGRATVAVHPGEGCEDR